MGLIVKYEKITGTIVAEVCSNGGTASNALGVEPLDWYVDAAWLEDRTGRKIRNLDDREIYELEDKDKFFGVAVIAAFLEDEKNHDPTPLE